MEEDTSSRRSKQVATQMDGSKTYSTPGGFGLVHFIRKLIKFKYICVFVWYVLYFAFQDTVAAGRYQEIVAWLERITRQFNCAPGQLPFSNNPYNIASYRTQHYQKMEEDTSSRRSKQVATQMDGSKTYSTPGGFGLMHFIRKLIKFKYICVFLWYVLYFEFQDTVAAGRNQEIVAGLERITR